MSETRKPNLPLLRKVLNQIDRFPDQWNQAEWAMQPPGCDTYACVAGWTCILGGRELVFDDEGLSDGTIGGPSIRYQAIADLEITSYEADRLFCWSSDRDDIQKAAEAIAARAGEIL